MCTFDISVPIRNFEKHLNSGIPSQHCDVLNEQILQKLIENFMDSETLGVTKYYCIRGGYGMNMNGVDVINSIGSSIKINFICRGEKFEEQINNYDDILNQYIESHNKEQSKLR